MWEHSGTFVAIAGFVLQFIVILAACIWKIAQLKTDVLAAIAITGKEIDERVDRQGRAFGETVQAIRAHINLEVTALRREINEEQKEVREIFVRRDSFYKVSEDLTDSIGKLGEKIEKRLERMEEKLNNKQERAES